MGVRLFDWRDLAALHRYRNESVFLDSALLLTRGTLLIPGVLFSYFAPSMGVFTCVSDGNRDAENYVMGQFIHFAGNPISHLTFLTPDEALEPASVGPLTEYMMTLSGERGALRLLADVDEHTQAFESLRKCGFVIYNRQRIWHITGKLDRRTARDRWREAIDQDVIPVRNLYNNLVPGLVQQIEPFPTNRPRGLVCYQDDELLGYVELKFGNRGIWVQPFIHPDATEVSDYLVDMLNTISGRVFRPIYICIRSYQSWLEPMIEAIGAEVGTRQAVMAKQLIVQQKAVRSFAIPTLEGGQAEITAPITHMGS
jgi:hypothetical protein